MAADKCASASAAGGGGGGEIKEGEGREKLFHITLCPPLSVRN